MHLVIKKVNFDESLEALFDLYSKVFVESYHIRDPKDIFIKSYKDCSVFITYDHTKPIGFIIFEDNNSFITLWELGVLPEYQHKGIGKLLMENLLAKAKHKEIHLTTNPRNSSAIIFYLKNGFEIFEWKENYSNNQPWIGLKRM